MSIWMNLENIMPNERSQVQKYNSPCVGGIKFLETKQSNRYWRLKGGWDGELLFNGTKFLFEVVKTFWKLIVMIVAQHCECP